MTDKLQAGVAAVNITPPVGNYLQGYTRGKPSLGIHRDIYAKALVFDDGSTKAAVVTTDLIGLEQSHVRAMREEVARWTDIPPEHVLINSSHSHGGPTVQGLGTDAWGSLWGNPPDPDYGRELTKKVGGLVAMANRLRRPIALGYGVGAATFNINRRLPTPQGTILAPNPNGAIDHRVKVLKIVDLAAYEHHGPERPPAPPLAAFFSFTCHPTIMAMANLEVSPDYPGVAQAFVEQAYGGGPTSGYGLPDGFGTVGLFAQGCCGDIRPNLTGPDGSQFRPGTKQDAHRLGRILGAEVVKICEETTVRVGEGIIRVASTRVTLPYQRLPSPEQLDEIVATGGQVRHEGHLDTAGNQFGDVTWAKIVLEKMMTQPRPHSIEAEVQAIRIGDLCIVGLPGEAFAEIGFQIEETIQGPSFVLGYSNGNVGYLCTQASFEGGGYEPAMSWMLYNHPAPFDPTNEHRLVEAGRAVAAQVRHS